jgi:serine/threonine protein kinase
VNPSDGKQTPKTLFDTWNTQGVIGEGSFGIVYRICKEDMGEHYDSAVKVISIPSKELLKEAESSIGNNQETLQQYFDDIVSNITKEIKLLYALSGYTNILNYQDHKIIKRVNDIGWDILIKMEYVQSLNEYQKIHQFTRDDVVRLGIDICTALEICAKKGIIHRDIKDENIFVNEDGIFKLGDFGIAKELSSSGSVAASKRGTPLYMAPEVYREEKYTSVVDIYSLGIVMYKLLNQGRMPFMPQFPEKVRYQDTQDALRRRLSGETLPIPVMADEKLGRMILKAAAFQPKERYQTASEFCESLRRINDPAPLGQYSASVVDNPNAPEPLISAVHHQEQDGDLNKTASVFRFLESRQSNSKMDLNDDTSVDLLHLDQQERKLDPDKSINSTVSLFDQIDINDLNDQKEDGLFRTSSILVDDIKHVNNIRFVEPDFVYPEDESQKDVSKPMEPDYIRTSSDNNEKSDSKIYIFISFVGLSFVASMISYYLSANSLGTFFLVISLACIIGLYVYNMRDLGLNKKIQFDDFFLDLEIRNAIGKQSGRIKSDDVWYIETLKLSNKNIRSITGLEHFKSLKFLDISYNEVEDLSALRHLNKLEYLYLKNNKVEDLWPIKDLQDLEDLDVRNNRIKDVQPLYPLTNLNKLLVMGNEIDDFSPIRSLRIEETDFD